MKKSLLLLFTLLIAFSAHSWALTGDEAVEKFKGRMFGLKSARGTISWTTQSGFMYTGNFKYLAPGRIHVKFTNPSGKIISCNGRKLWVYNPSSNICGVQELAPRGESGGIAALISGYSAIAMGGKGGYTIKLKNNERHYSSITLVVDQSFMLKKAVLQTKDGGGITISLSGVITGEGMSPGLFDFNPPSSSQTVTNPLNIK